MNALQQQGTWQALGDLADRLRRLCPDHRDPERFHIEKSEIEHALRSIARTHHGSSRQGSYAGGKGATIQSVQAKSRG
ncbi:MULTISPECIES: hypothetical protein [unclassified Haematobacter]|uniref:hypothetical protein n=1 Tax=unclassified Haematobacter TaxID=2640585 RepID=UPI0025BEFA76|nr:MULTISPECIES: hypothetical protein [unclassified Haematobacter]